MWGETQRAEEGEGEEEKFRNRCDRKMESEVEVVCKRYLERGLGV